MEVARITAGKAEEIKGLEYRTGSHFNPIQDGNGEWIVSLIEAEYIEEYEIIEFVEPEIK